MQHNTNISIQVNRVEHYYYYTRCVLLSEIITTCVAQTILIPFVAILMINAENVRKFGNAAARITTANLFEHKLQ